MTDPANIPAGAELNDAVALEVMGWKRLPQRFPGRALLQPPTRNDDLGEPVPGYSAHIQNAWLVVEKMREKGCGATVTVNPRGTYCAWFNTTYNQRHVAAGDTAPEAICRAALAAVRAQAKERT